MPLALQQQTQNEETTVEDTVKIITEGRISRLPHIVKVRFVMLHGTFFALAGDKGSDWVLNALKSGFAKVRLGGLVFSSAAAEASAEERSAVHDAFVSKYGARVVKEWYSKPAPCLRLTPRGPPTRRAVVKGEGEATISYGDWLAQNKEYYHGISEAFDSASEEYDFTISHNYINTWIRQRSISELLSVVNPDDTLIEIGCGTGAEAVEISKHVKRIIATDISERMIEILTKKIQAKKLVGKIIPLRARAADIGKSNGAVKANLVEAAYSFNGALNCEPDLNRFVHGLSRILVPRGYFVCSVRSSFCLSEALSHAAVLQFDRMAPRKKQPVMVSVGGMDIPAFYYPPAKFAELFSERFILRKTIGLPAFLPPAYLSDYYVKFKNVASVLEKFELALGDRFPFNRLGDQTLFVFQTR